MSGALDAAESGEDAPVGGWGPSLLHRAMRAEMDDVLKDGLARRTERLKRKAALLANTDASPATSAPRPAEHLGTTPLVDAMVKALRAANAATRPTRKVFGPTDLQETLADPQEENYMDIVAEGETLDATLESLRRNIHSRYRQIAALQAQLDVVLHERSGQEEAVERAEAARKDLDANGSVLEAHAQILERRRRGCKELGASSRSRQEDMQRLETLVRHQTRYIIQSKRIAKVGGQSVVTRNPAGELSLVPMPMPPWLDNDSKERYDIGTAIANPYVVDSWPFEPNVLARRSPQEGALPGFTEETAREMQDELMRIPFRGAPMPAYDDDDDEGDDGYEGPTLTARSL